MNGRSGPPIFVASFSRGGSSIVWNLLASSPDAVSLGQETHQPFLGNADDRSNKWRILNDLRHMLHGGGLPRIDRIGGQILLQYGLFEPRNLRERWIPRRLEAIVNERLELAAAAVGADPWLSESSPGVRRGLEELRTARIVAKNINGVNGLNESLAELYPGAIFVGLVRDGLALLESRVRRGTLRSAARFGVVYAAIVSMLLDQAARIPGFKVFRFEDLLDAPQETLADLYSHANLPTLPVHLRLKDKPHYRASGDYTTHRSAPYLWLPRADLGELLTPTVNDAQISRVTDQDRQEFLRTAGVAMELLGYPVEPGQA